MDDMKIPPEANDNDKSVAVMHSSLETTGGGGTSSGSTSRGKGVVVILAIIFFVVHIGLLLANENLRRDYFVQRLTGPLLVLYIVVIVFAAFPNIVRLQLPSITQKGGATLLGAGAFYYLLLGPITNALFPPDQTIAGYIYYQSVGQNQGLKPVPGVLVKVPETSQPSQPTGNDGRFVITNVSFRPKELDAFYSDTVYPFDLSKYQNNRYDIIPRPEEPRLSEQANIAAGEWLEVGNKCPDVNTAGYPKLKQLVLQKAVSVPAGYKNLLIKVRTQDPARILDAQKEEPDDQGFEDQLEEDRTQVRQWSLPARGDKTEMKIAVCLGARGKSPAPARNSLTTTYWFQQ